MKIATLSVMEPSAAEAEEFFEPIPDPTDAEPAREDVLVLDVDADITDDTAPTAAQALRYYGVDFDIEGLVRRFERRDLVIPSFDPAYESALTVQGFQRRFVWPKRQMDRFIESLLLGYPVPGIFLVEESSRRFLVLDGQQRVRTLAAFYSGLYGEQARERVFRLEYVAGDFRGLTYTKLSDADRRLLDSTVLQSTIVVPTGDLDAVYRVFERINSSGIKLQPQEIRVALYSGPAIHLLRDLNSTQYWRELFGPPHSRLKDHELILRYLALTQYAQLMRRNHWNREDAALNDPEGLLYRPSMVTYLNSYLQRHRYLQGIDEEAIRNEFLHITQLLNDAIGRRALRPTGTQINAAHADGVLVGMAVAARSGVTLTREGVRIAVDDLNDNEEFREAVIESTSHIDSVTNRLRIASEAFAITS
jgi:Protein of unknown function DUF262